MHALPADPRREVCPAEVIFFLVFSCFRGYAVIVERLQKLLSQAGVASRRASERLMIEGRVTVNGETIRELGTRLIRRETTSAWTAAHQARETSPLPAVEQAARNVTTRSDPQKRLTVIDLVGVREYITPSAASTSIPKGCCC